MNKATPTSTGLTEHGKVTRKAQIRKNITGRTRLTLIGREAVGFVFRMYSKPVTLMVMKSASTNET